MNIYKIINNIPSKNRGIALGSFDGIHLGHKAVISKTLEKPYIPTVFSFQQNPKKLLTGEAVYLMLEKDKEAVLKNLGVADYINIDFSAIMNLTPEDFFNNILIEKCGAKFISCGYDFRFGKNAAGTAELLKKLCERANIELFICPEVKLNEKSVGSTEIRLALAQGDVKTANQMLGRPFGFTLPIMDGNRIGRTLGTPTINQHLPPDFVKPKFGVYASLVTLEGNKHWGVTNIGVKPTVGEYKPLAETWIGEFDGDLYGKEIHLEILDFIRPEQKFAGLDELKAEIYRNADKAKEIAQNYLK